MSATSTTPRSPVPRAASTATTSVTRTTDRSSRPGTTRAIQTLLGLWIALTLALVVYALVDGSRPQVDAAPASAPHGVDTPASTQ